MNDTERRTGEQGGAYIGGRWVSDDSVGVDVEDSDDMRLEGRTHGIDP